MDCTSRAWVVTSFSGSLSCAPLTVPEGDVTGVMERPVGNTAEVYMECEKWYLLSSCLPGRANYQMLTEFQGCLVRPTWLNPHRSETEIHFNLDRDHAALCVANPRSARTGRRARVCVGPNQIEPLLVLVLESHTERRRPAASATIIPQYQ